MSIKIYTGHEREYGGEFKITEISSHVTGIIIDLEYISDQEQRKNRRGQIVLQRSDVRKLFEHVVRMDQRYASLKQQEELDREDRELSNAENDNE